MLRILLINAFAVWAYMSICFVWGYYRKRLDVVDSAWGGGFIVVALSSYLLSSHLYSGLLALLVGVWGLRLTLHIASRHRGKPNDPRYDALTEKWHPKTYWLRAYFSIFLLQGLLVLLISLPVSVAATIHSSSLSIVAILGCIVWAAGFLTEAVADYQLDHFIRTRTAARSVMDKGLWRYSRHPNYFGEIVIWVGVALIANTAEFGWLGWLGPLVICYLIVFVSGIPPIEKRKKSDLAYQIYAQQTSVLVPLPRKN